MGLRHLLILPCLGLLRAGAPCAVRAADLAVVGRFGEGQHLLILQCERHELLEQMRRVARGGNAIACERWHFLRAAVFRRIPNGPHIEQLRRVAHERSGLLVVCGTGLTGHLASETCRNASRGAIRGGALHGLLYQMAIVRIEHLLVLLRRLVQFLRTVGREHLVDDVQRVLHAIVRNGGVALRQIPHGNAVDAQNVVGGVFGDVFLNARLMRDLGEIRGAEVLVDLHEHRVHRIRGRLIEVDIPVIGVQRVRHLRGGSRRRFKRQARIAVEDGVEIHTLLRGSQQAERLHGGTRFERGLRGVVELLGEVIVARIHGFHGTGFRIDRNAAHLNAFRHALRSGVADLLNLVLHALVERGDDLVAAGFQIIGGERLGIDQFVLHRGQQIPVRAGHLVALLYFRHGRELRFLLLLGGDVAVFLHDAEHAVVSLFGLFLIDGRIP